MEMKKTNVIKLTQSAMLMAIGLVLPFVTGQIPEFGKMLLPMHIPVLLCGLICGWQYGLAVGFILPLLRGAVFGMPALFLNATAMAFELATYGAVVGVLYSRSRWQCVVSLYRCMIGAMVAGRIVWGAVMMVISGMTGSAFTWKLFMAGALINAVPGIVIQLILIPAIMVALNRAGLVTFRRNEKVKQNI